MKFLRVFTLLLLLFAVHPFAKHIAVLETGADSKDLVSDSDRQYLTNVFREQAVRILPAELNYTIMTRENISAMLPPGKAIEDCEGSCLAETGRNISADYVCQARIGSFGGDLTLSAELYETAENKLLASFNGRGKNVNELLDIIVKNSPDFFAKIKGLKGNYADLNELASNLGILVLKPVMEDSAGSEYPLNILVDGKKEEKTIIELEPGVHEVWVNHPCYDPLEYTATIEKGKTYVIDKKMGRGIAGIDLSVEQNGEPQEVAVYVDGVNVGKSPYAGTVPLCSKITVQGEGWSEEVNADLKWHLMTRVKHVLHRDSTPVVVGDVEAPKVEPEVKPSAEPQKSAEPSQPKVGESIPANVDADKGGIHWVPVGISAAVLAAGVVLAVVGNNQAKTSYEKDIDSSSDYKKNRDDAKNGQTLRGVGIGVAIAGAVGLGLSFVF